MGKFGWDLPPGVTTRMIDEAAGVYDTCDVCARFADNCICPECPQCGEHGNPLCYDDDDFTVQRSKVPIGGWHAQCLRLSREQRISRAERDARDAEQRLGDALAALDYLRSKEGEHGED